MNPKIEIKYISENKETLTVTLDDIRKCIGKDYSIPNNVEELLSFGVEYPEKFTDNVVILEIKVNGVAVWTNTSFLLKPAMETGLEYAKKCWQEGRKLDGVRAVVSATGFHLKDAKEYCEKYFNS